MSGSFISFTHNSDELRSDFSHKEEGRPCFYWFTDRYHSHTGFKIKDKYFYLFVKDPIKESITLIPRNNEDRSFNTLYEDFLYFKNNQNNQVYIEPPILMSFDTIVPDLIAEYHSDANEYEILKPTSHAGQRFKLFDDVYKEIWAKSIPFSAIPQLIETIVDLRHAIPVKSAETKLGKHFFADWLKSPTNTTGTWL